MTSPGSSPCYAVRPVEARDVDGLIALFERDGSPCFCRYWHHAGSNKEWEARCAFERDVNARELREAIVEGRDDGRGLVATVDADAQGIERIVGWMKLVPRAALAKLLVRAPYKGSSAPDDALAIGCFLIDPEHRRRGVAGLMVDAAIAIAERWGATAIEAYPRLAHSGGAQMHDGELFMGPAEVFAARGFKTVRDAAQYPTLRWSRASGSSGSLGPSRGAMP